MNAVIVVGVDFGPNGNDPSELLISCDVYGSGCY